MTPLKQIADTLTKAQREAILCATTTHPNVNGEPFVVVEHTDPWEHPVARFLSLRFDSLTPLGLELRRYLQDQDNAHT